MSLGGEQFVVGDYSVSWNGSDIGLFQGENNGLPTIFYTQFGTPIRASAYGRSPIDAVAQGGEVFAAFTCLEWPKALPLLFPFAAQGLMGTVGRLYRALSAPLAFTAT